MKVSRPRPDIGEQYSFSHCVCHLSLMEPQDVIQEIHEKYVNETPAEVRESLSGHSDVVQMSFAASYFPLEFIQNADDEEGTSIRFQLREVDGSPRLEILNDGHVFTDPDVSGEEVKSDVRGICKVGRSPKEPRNHIGFIGVGFKSIFEVSNRVEIHSGDFHFEFNRERTANEGSDEIPLPWRVIPWWCPPTEEEQTPVEKRGTEYTTRFVIHLDDSQFSDEWIESGIFEPLSRDNLDRRVFLFLESLGEIIIKDDLHGKYRHLQRRAGDHEAEEELQANIAAATGTYQGEIQQFDDLDPISTITVEEKSDQLHEQDTWVIFSNRWDVPEAVQQDRTTEDYFRSGIESREIFIGLLADDDGQLVSPGREGTVHSGVFSYLPLKELSTDFEFLVHADFLTPTDRQTIKRDARWNREIASAVAETLKHIAKTVAHHETWWKQLDLLMPRAKGDEFIESMIQNPVRSYFESERVLRDANEDFVRLRDAQRATGTVVNIFSVSEFRSIKDNYPLHPAHDSIYATAHGGSTQVDIENILTDSRAPDTLQQMAKSEETPATFAAIYRAVVNEVSEYRWERVFKNTGILLEDGTVTGTNDAEDLYRLVGDRSFELVGNPIPAVEERISVVNRKVLSLDNDEEIIELLDKIGVTEITNPEIVNIWLQETPWEDIPGSDRIPVARICKRGVVNGELEGEKVTGLKLREQFNEGKWHPPKELLLSEAYNPVEPAQAIEGMSTTWLRSNPGENTTHSREELTREVKQQLFTEAGLPVTDGTLRFLSTEYLDTGEDRTEAIDSWREFCYAIGVDSLVRDPDQRKKFAGCLGELYVEHRLAQEQEVEIQNVKIGRDIQTAAGARGIPDRIIEVKSTAERTNSFDLSIAQTKVLTRNEDSYWVYSVTSVFTAPTITRAKGSDILEQAETKIHVGSADWDRMAMPFEDG